MTETELLKLAADHGYQLVPIPATIDHDIRPGDVVEDHVPRWAQALTRKAAESGTMSEESRGILASLGMEPQRGTVLAVASRADVLIRFDNGRVGFRAVKDSMTGEMKVRKVT